MSASDFGVNLNIRLQPKQATLYDQVCTGSATWLGYGGSRGGGKSGGGRNIMLLRRLENPGTRGLIFRRTWKDLRENHVDPLFDAQRGGFPELRQFYHSSDHELRIPTGLGTESVIVFGYAEHSGDINSFLGKEYFDIFVDQAEQLTQREMELLKTCNRWPGKPEGTCKTILGFNPGGIGHSFLARIFHKKAYVEHERPDDYAFLQAYGWDNIEWVRPYLEANGISEKQYYAWSDEDRFKCFISHSEYGRSLNALPQAMRLGHLLGSFDQFAGQYFDNFDQSKHVAAFQDMEIKPWHPRWISIDWGYSHPSAVYWHAQDGGLTKTYRELLENRLGPRALAQMIVEHSLNDRVKIHEIYLSPDAYAKKTSEDTIAEQMGQVFRQNGLPGPAPADNDRVGGWMLMRECLEYGKWIISDTCPRLIETLPMLVRDEDHPEDCVKFEGDDAADGARYGLKSRLGSGRPPLEERILAQMKSPVEDVQARMIEYKRVELEEKKKTLPVKFFRRRIGRA